MKLTYLSYFWYLLVLIIAHAPHPLDLVPRPHPAIVFDQLTVLYGMARETTVNNMADANFEAGERKGLWSGTGTLVRSIIFTHVATMRKWTVFYPRTDIKRPSFLSTTPVGGALKLGGIIKYFLTHFVGDKNFNACPRFFILELASYSVELCTMWAYLNLVIPLIVTCTVDCGMVWCRVCGSLSPAPPLTLENIMKEVEGVRYTSGLELWFRGYTIFPIPSITDLVESFLHGHGPHQPSWRAVIFTLDAAGEAHVANRIRHYAEPVPGRYMLCD